MSQSVQEIVNLVKASNCLGKTKRQHNLLLYLLTEKEHGRLEEISQYSIAKEVLGRDNNFDPTTDSIVRVEMHRLRKNLEEFNKSSKDTQITIPAASFGVVVTNNNKASKALLFKKYQKPLTYASAAMGVLAFGLFSLSSTHKITMVPSNCSSIIPNINVVNSGSETNLQLYAGKLIRSTLSQYTNIHLIDNIGRCANSGTPSYTLDYMVLEENGLRSQPITNNHQISLTSRISAALLQALRIKMIYIMQLLKRLVIWQNPMERCQNMLQPEHGAPNKQQVITDASF